MCNLCISKQFCCDCQRSQDDEEFQNKIEKLSTRDQNKARLAYRKGKAQDKLIVEASVLFFNEQPFHIVSFKEKNANYKVYTKEGVLFYLRKILHKDETFHYILIKKEKFLEKDRLEEIKGEEVKKILPLPATKKFVRKLAWQL